MQEYTENGVSFGWLIDPLERKVYVYRAEKAVEILDNPEKIFGESPVEGFTLSLEDIFD